MYKNGPRALSHSGRNDGPFHRRFLINIDNAEAVFGDLGSGGRELEI